MELSSDLQVEECGWRLRDGLVDVGPAHEDGGPLPHGRVRGRVVEEHRPVARPHHAPAQQRQHHSSTAFKTSQLEIKLLRETT